MAPLESMHLNRLTDIMPAAMEFNATTDIVPFQWTQPAPLCSINPWKIAIILGLNLTGVVTTIAADVVKNPQFLVTAAKYNSFLVGLTAAWLAMALIDIR